MAKKYYLDICIWLNLFKKEGDASKGKPYWKITEEFIRKVLSKHDKIKKIHRKLLPAPKGIGLMEFSFDSGFLGWEKPKVFSTIRNP